MATWRYPVELARSDFNTPESLARQGLAYQKVIHVFGGLYVWEFLISWDFDWGFICRKQRFRWPLAIYFGGRYMMLGYIAALLASVDVSPRLDCQSLMAFLAVAADTSVGFASLNLALRAIAVWNRSRYVVLAIALMTLGHWSLILQAGRITAEYVPAVQGCAIIATNNRMLIATIMYSMAYDLAVTALVTWTLAFPRAARSEFVRKLYRDGIGYFLIVLGVFPCFLVTCFGTIMLSINLSPLINAICLSPSAIITTIASNRAVRRLNNFYGTSTTHEASTSSDIPTFRLGSGLPREQFTTDIDTESPENGKVGSRFCPRNASYGV